MPVQKRKREKTEDHPDEKAGTEKHPGKRRGRRAREPEPWEPPDAARKADAVRYLAECAAQDAPVEDLGRALWETLIACQGGPYVTAKGLEFTYSIRGNEMFVDRKEKSITRASVSLSFRRALEVQRSCGCVSGPKKLGTFGASYLYPVFLRLGVIRCRREGLDQEEIKPMSVSGVRITENHNKNGHMPERGNFMKRWTRALYQPNLPLKGRQHVTASEEHIALSLAAAEEGMVLLKNEGGLLPLREGSRVALFGKGSFDYVKGGGGSGDVTVSYVRNLYEGLKLQEGISLYEPLSDFYRSYVDRKYAEGAAPGMMAEAELPESLADRAAVCADTAVIALSRFSGEGWDRSSIEFCGEFNPFEEEVSMPQTAGKIFPEGDFYLTAEEKALIAQVERRFGRIVVVLNVGGMMDTSWFRENEKISSVLLGWQGGMEGGLAMARLLVGAGNPSGKLPDTFAGRIEDYPSTANFHESPHYVDYTDDIYVGYRYFETIPGAAEKVCYPFGFGLSYTAFETEMLEAREENGRILVEALVTNMGDRAGKEVAQLYYSAPQGLLGKPGRELAAFKKTRCLKPGESQSLTLSFHKADMASYDDLGKIAKSAYVLEKGEYLLYLGNSVRDAEELPFTVAVKQDEVTEQLSPRCVPTSLKERMRPDGSYEALPLSEPKDPDECAFEKMVPGTDEGILPHVRRREQYLLTEALKGRSFQEVADGTLSLEDFMAQLSEDDLIELLGGHQNLGVANTFGMGDLPEYGVPNIMTADGPAGLRIRPECGICTTAWPCATLLASTWNEELVEQVGRGAAEEVKENNIAVWLAPAVNIHRNPLCGRNFEYYSEDPYLAGKLASAMVRGIQSQHIAASVKHFACNNKETNRKQSDSRVSERAMREIYLKAFEIIVKEADPWTIMSSYNIINGVRASENRELLEDILRGEWGYKGLVTTDWWNRAEQYKEIKAGNDVKMACGYPERVRHALELGVLTRADLEHCARRVLELILKID